MTRPLTPENLRLAARSIELMQRVIEDLLKKYELKVTRRDGSVAEHEEAVLLDFVTGTAVQDDMREWADQLERADNGGGAT